MTGDKGAWGGGGAREYWRAALRGCQQSLQAQWPPFFVMMSLKARKPFIQGANLPPEGLKTIVSLWYLWGHHLSRYLCSVQVQVLVVLPRSLSDPLKVAKLVFCFVLGFFLQQKAFSSSSLEREVLSAVNST